MSDWQRIRYPAPLRPGDTIGVTAPSSGVAAEFHPRLDVCLAHLRDLGFKVVEGSCLRTDAWHVSGSREARATDLLSLWTSKDVGAIFPPWGGELLVHLLPCIDFDWLAATQPKWILGYSDTSTLLFAMTLLTGIATAHGTTLMEMVPNQVDPLSRQWLDVVGADAGGCVEQKSSGAYQMKGPDWRSEPMAVFTPTEPTRWRCMQRGRDVDSLAFSGRLIGGCLETLSSLVGTPYGDLPAFRRRFDGEGLILFLENAESAPPVVCRMLWNMRLAGWFDGLAGLLLGRSRGPDSETFSYLGALHDALDDLPVPVIYDADIGHCPPQMTLINGAVATVESSAGTGRVTLTLV